MAESIDPSIRVERTCYPDGTPKEEIHYKGKRNHGPWRKWHANGQLAEECWLEDGVYTNCTNRMWHPNGAVSAEAVFVRGKAVVTRVYSDTGELVAQIDPQAQRIPIRKWINRAMAAKPRKAKLDPDAAARADAFAKERLDGGATADAKQWLRDGRAKSAHTLGELDVDTSLELIIGLDVIGAKSVFAVEIESSPESGYQTSNQLIVELPGINDDPGARARVFSLERSISREQGFDPTPDQGQTYVYLKLC